MSCEQTDSTAPERAKTQAKADLLLALYTHVAHDLEQTQSERDRLRDERDQARNELHYAREDINRRGDELGQSQLHVAEMQQRYDALLNSTSWRLTAPLRALVRLVKR